LCHIEALLQGLFCVGLSLPKTNDRERERERERERAQDRQRRLNTGVERNDEDDSGNGGDSNGDESLLGNKIVVTAIAPLAA